MILAKKLQKPRAVALKSVGNTSTVELYSKTKAPAIPNFVNTTKIGSRIPSVCSPRKRIQHPPAHETANSNENDFFKPSFEYSTPEVKIATNSEPPLAKVLV